MTPQYYTLESDIIMVGNVLFYRAEGLLDNYLNFTNILIQDFVILFTYLNFVYI